MKSKKFYVPISFSGKLNLAEELKNSGIFKSRREVLSRITDDIYDAKHEGIDDLNHSYVTITVKKITPVAVTKPEGERGKVKYFKKKS